MVDQPALGTKTTAPLLPHFKPVAGSTTTLLRAAANRQVQWEVRLAAVVQFNHTIRSFWPIRNNDAEFILTEEEERTQIRTLLVEAVLADEPETDGLFGKTLLSLVTADNANHGHDSLHQKWPTLLPSIKTILSQDTPTPQRQQQQQQQHRVYNAVSALAKVCKAYEFKSRCSRRVLDDIVHQFWDSHLLPLAQQQVVLANGSDGGGDAQLLKQLFKIFWRCTHFYLPKQRQDTIDIWLPFFDVLRSAMRQPALAPSSTKTTSFSAKEQSEWPWWKAKKWAIRIITRFFSRYGYPEYADEDVQGLSRGFNQTVAPSFLELICDETLRLRPCGQFCSDVVLSSCLQYLSLASDFSNFNQVLQPRWNFILTQVCFPTICLSTQDVEGLEKDTHAFLNPKGFCGARESARLVIADMPKHHGAHVSRSVLMLVSECLEKYAAAKATSSATSTDEKNCRSFLEKDGALQILALIIPNLEYEYNHELERVMVSFVLPEFRSPIPLLRYRACWMMTHAYVSVVERIDVAMIPKSLQEPNLHASFWIPNVLDRLQTDPSLGVRCEAGRSLLALMELEGANELVRPQLGTVVGGYLRLLNEIADSKAISGLTAAIETFPHEMEPHILTIVTELSCAFVRYSTSSKNSLHDEEKADEMAMLATECLSGIAGALQSLRKTLCKSREMCHTLETTLLPHVLNILACDGKNMDYLKPALAILGRLSQFSHEISIVLWEALPLVCQASSTWAKDYLSEMLPYLQNCIAKAPHGPSSFVDLIFATVAKTVRDEKKGQEDRSRTCLMLYRSVLDNCRGSVDAFLPLLNDVILAKLHVSDTEEDTRFASFQVLGSAFCYNPHLQLAELEKRSQCSVHILEHWMMCVMKTHRWPPKKVMVMAIASLLQIPIASMPVAVADMMPRLVAAAIQVTHYRLMWEGDDQDIDNEEENDDECMEDVFGGVGWEQADESYTSPLMEMDHLIFLSEALKGTSQREPETYQQIQASLPEEVVSMFHSIYGEGDARLRQAGARSF